MTTELQAAATEILQKNTGGITYHIVEHYGTVLPITGTTIGEHWRVNGKVFYHNPTEEEVKAAYSESTKEKKRMTEEELDMMAMRIAETACLHPSDQIMCKGLIKDLAEKYRGES